MLGFGGNGQAGENRNRLQLEKTSFPIPPDRAQRDGAEIPKTISMRVCFVLKGEKLYLHPVRGSDTEG